MDVYGIFIYVENKGIVLNYYNEVRFDIVRIDENVYLGKSIRVDLWIEK